MTAAILRSTAIAAILAVFADQTTAAAVALKCRSCPSRFAWENDQLTDAAIANSDASLFGFGSDVRAADLNVRADTPDLPACKAFPGDASWPSQSDWNLFNTTLDGALIQTVPLAASCYNNWPQHDAAACQDVISHWNDPHFHVNDPTSAMFPLYQGRTCMPTDDPSSSNCTLGGYAAYSVAVTKVSQIQLALNFARNTNVRLVVKNTGHDFGDKSIGAGALSVWTHNLKDIEFLADYKCKGFNGPAFRLGSGVETEDLYRAAEQNNVTVVGGECRTVGIAGGYIAGGGHSPLSSLVGMGADQVLSMEVVLPNGKFVTANKDSNPDLYWALRGGGGSTYGVVTSVTVRAYPQIPVTTMTFMFTTGADVTADTFFAGLGAYMSHFDAFTAAGAYGYFLVVGTGPGEFLFNMMPMWGNNMTKPQFVSLVTPFLDDLAGLGISLTPVITEYPSMYSAYTGTFPPENVGPTDSHAASRLFPKENFESAKRDETLSAVRHAIEGGGVLIGYNIRSAPNPSVDQANSVNPAWRKATGFFILAATWAPDATDDKIQQASETLTNDWMAKWRAVSPGAGSYMSEGDINEPDFQQSFYGEYYPRLYAMKQQYDPTGLFYAPTAVGSEDWYVTDQVPWIPTQNGRLCRKA
ncbi:bifunctional solanapyrone synthase [Chaetomidium leptoderma]|uniref:Bifunctional solanapyrone synthase n=1 Tax=Chaetomidium leptoderma TaxID=669021 RepID=A0AAN6VWZ1_9PEZI|nr:bifunctional solanapyrone synthase [Chaetomidium leptoderma]